MDAQKLNLKLSLFISYGEKILKITQKHIDVHILETIPERIIRILGETEIYTTTLFLYFIYFN